MDRKYTTIEMGKGKVLIGPRPDFKDVISGAIPADSILTLQKATEKAFEMSRAARNGGYKWYHAPCTAFDLKFIDDRFEIQKGVMNLIELLERGDTVFVHCREGKHRSGTVLLNTMRKLGYNINDAVAVLVTLQPEHTEMYLDVLNQK